MKPAMISASASLRVIELEARFVGRELGSALLPCITSSDAALRSAALESITVEAADASGLSAVLRTHLEHGSAAWRQTALVVGGGSLTNDAVLTQEADGGFVVQGDPTEAAFLVAELEPDRAQLEAEDDELTRLLAPVFEDADDDTLAPAGAGG